MQENNPKNPVATSPFNIELVKTNEVWNLLHNLSQKVGITEIVINNHQSIFVEKESKFYPLDVKLKLDHLHKFIQDVATLNFKKCNEEYPLLDGTLPDGSRINIVTGPIVKNIPAITIRKYLFKINNFDSTPGIFGLNHAWTFFLKTLVKARMNIIISGGTGTGKTTLLNLLLQEVPRSERIITIEDTKELNFNLPNVVRLEVGLGSLQSPQVNHRALVKNALRMRPDRIIIGEVRGEELIDLLTAMNTGHDGSMTSIHANTAQDTIKRMSTLYQLGGQDVQLKAIYQQIQSAVQYIININRDKNGSRSIQSIIELTGMEKETILMQTIAQYDGKENLLKPTGITPTFMEKLNQHGLDLDYFNTAF